MGVMEGTAGIKEARGEYDFAVDGGAVGTLVLRGDGGIPNVSVILGGYIEVDTPVTGGAGATISVGANTTVDLLAAAIFSGAPWSTAGLKAVIPVWTAATMIKATAARALQIAIAVNPLTAGKFRVVVFYR